MKIMFGILFLATTFYLWFVLRFAELKVYTGFWVCDIDSNKFLYDLLQSLNKESWKIWAELCWTNVSIE